MITPKKLETPPVIADNSLYDLLKRIHIPRLARDMAMFGEDTLGVLRSHGVGYEAFKAIQKMPEYKQHYKETMAALEADPRQAVRSYATVLLKEKLPVLAEMASDASLRSSDRIKALELLAKLADAMPRTENDKGTTGVMVNLNFGSTPAPETIEMKTT